jgi:VanZ family protein
MGLGVSADSAYFPSTRRGERRREFQESLREEMQWLLRVVCIGYVVFLTMLLLSVNPSRLIGVHGELPWALQKLFPVAHVVSFLVLAVLALVPRWPIPRWGLVVILAVYGGMTEIIQSFLPPRTAEWADWFQDLAGIAAGTAIWWAVAMTAGRRMRREENGEHPTIDSGDDRKALEAVVGSREPVKETRGD